MYFVIDDNHKALLIDIRKQIHDIIKDNNLLNKYGQSSGFYHYADHRCFKVSNTPAVVRRAGRPSLDTSLELLTTLLVIK